MPTIKEQEKVYVINEKVLNHLYKELIDRTLDIVQATIDEHVDNYFKVDLKKSQKMKPIFDSGLFLSLEDIISNILDPLKIIINKTDARLDILESFGLPTMFLTMHDVYRQAYRIQSDYAKFLKKPKHTYSWRKDALEWMEQNTGRHIDKHILSFSNDIIDRLRTATSDAEKKLYDQIQHKEKTKELVREEMVEAVKKRKSLVDVKQIFKDKTGEYHRNWDLIIKTEFAMAKNIASVQSIEGIGSVLGQDPTVAIVDLDDDRVTEFCHNNSRNADGSIKLVKLSDLKPAGYNLGKKESEWKNSVPPRHFNCRCWIVYVPEGFYVDTSGHLKTTVDNKK